MLLYILKELVDEVLENRANKKWKEENTGRLQDFMQNLVTQYKSEPGHVIDIIRKLQEEGYDLCFVWGVVNQIIMKTQNVQRAVAQMKKDLYPQPIKIIYDMFSSHDKLTEDCSRSKGILEKNMIAFNV